MPRRHSDLAYADEVDIVRAVYCGEDPLSPCSAEDGLEQRVDLGRIAAILADRFDDVAPRIDRSLGRRTLARTRCCREERPAAEAHRAVSEFVHRLVRYKLISYANGYREETGASVYRTSVLIILPLNLAQVDVQADAGHDQCGQCPDHRIAEKQRH